MPHRATRKLSPHNAQALAARYAGSEVSAQATALADELSAELAFTISSGLIPARMWSHNLLL